MENIKDFEQYKKDQSELEKILTIKPEFHFILDDISKKILNNEELSTKERGDLEMVFDMVQDLDKELISALDLYRSEDVISKIEFLITSDYFLTAEQNGPDSANLKEYFTDKYLDKDGFNQISQGISIPQNTREILVKVYKKIFNLSKGSVS